ncbi:hypothetical protein H4R19_007009, partial [Coemansia spiralis]
MAQVCILETRIVEQIIEAACRPAVDPPVRLAAYKQLVPLAAVCRAWRPLVLAYLASVLIVEFQCAADPSQQPPQPPPRAATEPAAPGVKPKRKGEGAARALSVWRNARPSSSSLRKTPVPVPAVPAAAPQWQSNIVVILGAASSGATVVRLRLQSFEARPDFAGLVGAMTADGFARCNVSSVHTIEIVDLSETATSNGTSIPDPAKSDRWWAPECIEDAAAYLGQAMPAVRVLSSASWTVSAATRMLATHLASRFFGQLEVLSAALASPIVAVPGGSAPLFAQALTTLQIQAGILEQSGAALVPAAQLQTLKLFEAEPFFSWA